MTIILKDMVTNTEWLEDQKIYLKTDDTPEEEHAIVLNTIYVPCHIILVRGNIENDPTQNSHTEVSLCSKIW